MLVAPQIWAQENVTGLITGQVWEAETDLPLAGVNVFLNGTSFGAISNAEGVFVISDIPVGNYELVASMLGYDLSKQPMRVDGRATEVVFHLTPVVYDIAPVDVVAEAPKHWQRDLRRFTRIFLGQSSRARQCTIRNPEVLDFSHENGQFTATALAPLEIENRALGYEIRYHLQIFRANNETIAYDGAVEFTPMTPKDEKEAKKWRQNRQRIYEGSIQHFLRSLVAGTHPQAYFSVYGYQLNRSSKDAHLALIGPGREPFERELRLPGKIEVHFLNQRGQIETSWISALKTPIYFDLNGRFAEVESYLVEGIWSQHRVAEQVPWEYPTAHDLEQ